MGCDIKKYIQEGKFKIYDSYSSLHGLSVEDVKISVGEEYYSAIVRVEDPYDSEKYFTEQINTIREIGPGGVNIIDCVNVRYQITEKQKEKDEVTYKEHFSRFKATGGDTLKNVGIHIVEVEDNDDELIKHLTRVEDGNIRLKKIIDEETGDMCRYLRVEDNGQYGRGDTKWYEYTVKQKGICILSTNF